MAPLDWYRFSSLDPAVNLAKEEVVFDTLDESRHVLVLYVNDRCVVCGKHQNPWREIDLAAARRAGVPVHRRVSGGGTVYHDPGNLIFSFMTRRDALDREANLETVRAALRRLEIGSDRVGTFDLYAAGRKISGNAFCFRRNRAMHHGTLLLSADHELMGRLLKAGEPAITTHAVASRPAHTTSLRSIDRSFDIASLERAIVEEAAKAVDATDVRRLEEESIDPDAVRVLAERNRSWDWNFGRTPAFTVTFSVGEARALELGVRHGLVESVTSAPEGLASADLVGARFDRKELLARTPIEAVAIRRAIEASPLL